jgi:hypothetical protein
MKGNSKMKASKKCNPAFRTSSVFKYNKSLNIIKSKNKNNKSGF